tara:strand:+ start:3275 stop:3439 length:165 start_codon:yes stop_codon:yes gene_type:complete
MLVHADLRECGVLVVYGRMAYACMEVKDGGGDGDGDGGGGGGGSDAARERRMRE